MCPRILDWRFRIQDKEVSNGKEQMSAPLFHLALAAPHNLRGFQYFRRSKGSSPNANSRACAQSLD